MRASRGSSRSVMIRLSARVPWESGDFGEQRSQEEWSGPSSPKNGNILFIVWKHFGKFVVQEAPLGWS